MSETYEAAVEFLKSNWIIIALVLMLVLVFIAGRFFTPGSY